MTDRGAPVTGPAIVLNLVGGSFAACGLIAWRRRPDSRSGALMTATGFAFFVPALLFPRDSSLAVTTASLVADLWILFFVPLILTLLTAGRLRSRIDWGLEWAFIVGCVVLQLVFLLFSEQERNLLAVFPDDGIADVIDKAQRGILVGACAATAYVVGARWARASRPRRRALLPGVAGMLVLTMFAALLVNDLVAGERSQALLWIAACSLVSVPAAFLAGLLRSRLARGALADLMLTIRTTRGDSLEAALGRTLHDPELVVAYRLPESLGYADSAGRPVLVPPVDADRSSAAVERDGCEIATLIYDASLDDDPELVEAVSAAAAIAIENERLQAESAQRVVELQASRERIVAAGDAERRRLERNLHDGAQQRLVAIALQLRLLQGRIQSDPAAAEELATAASDGSRCRWPSCASWRAGSTRRCSSTGSPPRCSRLRPARWSTRRWPTSWRARCPSRSSWRPTSWPPRRWRTSPSTRTRRRCASACGGRRTSRASRSPTTASAAPRGVAGPACAALPTASRRWRAR